MQGATQAADLQIELSPSASATQMPGMGGAALEHHAHDGGDDLAVVARVDTTSMEDEDDAAAPVQLVFKDLLVVARRKKRPLLNRVTGKRLLRLLGAGCWPLGAWRNCEGCC